MTSDKLSTAIEAAEKSELVLNIFGFICSLTFLIIYIIFFYKLRQFDKARKRKTNPWIMILPLMYTICYTLRYLLKIISVATDYIDVYLQVTFDFVFIFGAALFYVIMILRLALGFKGSQYELSRMKLILCCVALFGIIIINIFHYLIKRNASGKSVNVWHANKVDNDLFIALVFSNLAFAAYLIYLFVRTIVLMIKDIMEVDDDQSELSETHIKWLSVAVKYALLCGIAIAFTNIQFSLWILFNFGVFENNPVGGIYFSIFNDWLWIIVMITNYLCILLTFPSKAEHIYNRICVSCHGCCQSIIKGVIVKPPPKEDTEREHIVADDGDRAQLTVQMADGQNEN